MRKKHISIFSKKKEKKGIHNFPETESFEGRNRSGFFFFIRRQDQQATKRKTNTTKPTFLIDT